MRELTRGEEFYEGTALLGDPVHGYISFTTPRGGGEKTEKDIIDTPWMQRLRQIYQLQSARWVYPSAEHSRFQHSLGAMHLAGRFARHLYPSLKAAAPDCPSANYIEELLRVTALLHDVGHGPFGHFFDDNYLEQFGLTHEKLGQHIIKNELAAIIRAIHRGPNGEFAKKERLDPEQIAFLIGKGPQAASTAKKPQWLVFLQPLLSGIYTVDNLDYVMRDAYMCGVAIGAVDIDRLMYYTFFSDKGLTLHKSGLTALNMFLNARLYMYTNVYYHRTTRAIDEHLKELFKDTMAALFPYNPVENLRGYLELTDWSLLEAVRKWGAGEDGSTAALGREWSAILSREVKWKMAYDVTLSMRAFEKGKTIIDAAELVKRIRKALPAKLKDLEFRVDMASQDPRPVNPLMMGERQIYVFNPSTRKVEKEPLKDFFDYIPARVVQCRVFTLNHDHDEVLADIVESVLGIQDESIKTNV
ncbi:MAG TPA: HD domain-containing protein [Nitrospirota bacterium]|nr:HD domain-containing protein [Nitrospirota bacterium]